MSSINEVLRKALKANGMKVYGSKNDMLLRLLQSPKDRRGPGRPPKIAKAKSIPKPVNKAKKTTMLKGVKNGGVRLSAAYYFKEVCGGKLYNTEPQWILQPDGSSKLKKIKLCDDAWGGRCAKWVNV